MLWRACLFVILLALAVPLSASIIPVGYAVVDINTSPATYEVDVSSLTGANGLPPDFPVTNSVAFQLQSVVITFSDTTTASFDGSYFSAQSDGLDWIGSVESFDSLNPPVSAVISGTFATTTLDVSGVGSVTILPDFSVAITDSPSLQDQDSVEIDATDAPEPAAWALIAICIPLLLIRWGRSILSERTALRILAIFALAITFPPKAAYSAVVLSSTASPNSGVAGGTTVYITGSGFPAQPYNISQVAVSLSASCGGPASASAPILSIKSILGSTYRVGFQLPASLTASGVYQIAVSGQNAAGTSFNSQNCAAMSVTGSAQTITVNWPNVQQTIDGFGGSVVGFVSAMDPGVLDAFFRTDTGIGLSIVRMQMVPSVADCTPAITSGLAVTCVATSGATVLNGELANAQQAQSRGVSTFFATSWSPDGPYKTGGVWWAGGSLIGTPSNYAAIAANMASYAALLSANGVPLSVFSPQNEPNISANYGSCLWTGQQFHDFLPYLKSAFANAGVSSTKILIPEEATWSFDDFSELSLTDSAVSPDVDILAAHGYGSANPTGPPTITGLNGQHVWMTEVSSTSQTFDGSMNDALGWATTIHSYLSNAHVNAWIWWFLSDQLCCGNGTDNSALTDYYGNFPMRMWATGNWSRFVRPGWHEVSVTNTGALLVTAFQDPTNSHTAMVVINNGSNPVSQMFSVGPAMGASVAPYLTSQGSNLAAQSPVSIVGGSFTYTLPASSVTTFVSK